MPECGAVWNARALLLCFLCLAQFPHLQDWSNPNTTGTWRGMIGRNFNSTQWATWFSWYQPFILHYAELATTIKADSMCVGMELIDASAQSSYWRTVVAGVRARYSGPLLYAANHGNEDAVQWWDAVDWIGVDAYYPLAPSNTIPCTHCSVGWKVCRLGITCLPMETVHNTCALSWSLSVSCVCVSVSERDIKGDCVHRSLCLLQCMTRVCLL